MAYRNPNLYGFDSRHRDTERPFQSTSPPHHHNQFYRRPTNQGGGDYEVNPRSEISTSVGSALETGLHSHPEYVDSVETDDLSYIGEASLPFTSRVRNDSDSSGSHSPVVESNLVQAQVLEECVPNTPLNPAAARFRDRELFGFMNYAERIRTFNTWRHEIIDKEVLAEAGFYFTGRGDCVKCARCGAELEGWASGDDPRQTHFDWFQYDCF